MNIEADTKLWTRNKSDAIAIADGCFFDVPRGAFTVWWIEKYCKLYEGEYAGQPVRLRAGCEEEFGWEPIEEEWDEGGEELAIERAAQYSIWLAEGNSPDWQYECTMRMFGWAVYSERYKRNIRRFNAASITIPKKNKKSPTLAAWGNYLTCGDSEMGAKCFGGAKDGNQASISMDHATAMIEQSPELSAVCKINKNEKSIYHIPTKSKYMPLSSADERTKNAKEGINGNILIDECFVAGTKVSTPDGEISIDKVLIGDRIFNALGVGEVIGVSRREVSEPIYKLEFSNGTKLECTGSHPIFTNQGWTQARLMDVGEVTFSKEELRDLRESVLSHKSGRSWRSGRRKSKGNRHLKTNLHVEDGLQQKEVLLSGVCSKASAQESLERSRPDYYERLQSLRREVSSVDKRGQRKNVRNGRESIRKAKMLFDILQQEAEQPNAQIGQCGESKPKAQGAWAQAFSARREWQWHLQASRSITESTRLGLGRRVCGSSGNGSRERLANALQARFSQQVEKDLYRSGRAKPLRKGTEGVRQEEGQVLEKVRLVRVSRTESESTRTVYNLHVGGHPSYFANGHLVHNCHVVDWDFIKIIRRAGISRAEPFRIEVSTAGNNPGGYGKHRQDQARQVQCGAEKNNQLFVAIYEAPQDLTAEQLAKDPVYYGKMANPAWGHTVNEQEYLNDYNESKRTIKDLADFMMYRLDIWQHTANQWLRVDDWSKCRDTDWSIDTLAGKKASVGMDLSKTRDMSALALMVPIGDLFYHTAKIFTTEAFVQKNCERVPDLLEWQASGELIVIPGDIIDESYIWNAFVEWSKILKVSVLVYDKTYARDFTEKAEKEYGSKLLLIDYPQFPAAMEKPIDDYQAMVVEGKMRHDNNRCMNWQAGHASIVENAKGHRIVRKPKRDDYRKVDAMVASVMARFGCGHLPKTGSVYSRRGVLCG